MLDVDLCGKKLVSPIILGSGTLGERKETLVKYIRNGAGAVVTRTLRLDNTQRELFMPNCYFTDNYMLNADNNNLTPWGYWVDAIGEVEREGPVIISMSARHPDDCDEMVTTFEKNTPPSFYELNFSCSHSARLYGRISYGDVERSLKHIKRNASVPVFLKLSLDNVDFDAIVSIEDLFDAYVLSNTIGPAMVIDVKTRQPVLKSVYGGFSGAAIKPLVIAKAYDLRQRTSKPIIGVGGIETADDVLEYLILGCDAVQIYTAAHRRGPVVFNEINSDLEKRLSEMGETVSTIKGTLKV